MMQGLALRKCVELENDALLLMLSDTTSPRIGSDSIFASAVLRLTNQFSEFYHNATDTMQGLRHIVNQPLLVLHHHHMNLYGRPSCYPYLEST